MPDPQLLATILQISDLHFGEPDPVSGDARDFSAIPPIVQKHRHFDGLLGHHFRALEHLQEFCEGLRTAGEQPYVVVTGDVTRTGNGNEFDTADDYLISRLIFGNKVAGLMLGDWRDRAITGNHDQWPGNLTILGGPTAARVTYFPLNTFPSEFPIPLPGGRTIRLIKIDSDVDVHPFGAKRFFAHGSFVSQLNTLGMSLAPKADGEIRVLVLHHSPAHTNYVLGIDSASRDELARVLLDKDICVLMTGHMHKPLLHNGPPDVKRPHMVLESRSGTTTQMDVVPAARLAALWQSDFAAGLPQQLDPAPHLRAQRDH
ncbi:MAG: metallophosphoesterase [Planctomycetia bacterium]|nr:metallophosphoesterase [Planctomycetia bacterium]